MVFLHPYFVVVLAVNRHAGEIAWLVMLMRSDRCFFCGREIRGLLQLHGTVPYTVVCSEPHIGLPDGIRKLGFGNDLFRVRVRGFEPPRVLPH